MKKGENLSDYVNLKYFENVAPHLVKHMLKFYQSHYLKKCTFKNHQLEYIDSGTGSQTILIFHGATGNAQSVFELIQEYESTYRVIAPSIKDYDNIDDMIGAIRFLLDEEHISKVIIRSGSFGSMMAQAFLKRNLEIISGIILANSYPPNDEWNKDYRRTLLILRIIPFFLVKKAFAKKILRMMAKPQENITREQRDYQNFQNAFYAHLLKFKINKSVLIIQNKLVAQWNKADSENPVDLSNWGGKMLIIIGEKDSSHEYIPLFQRCYPEADICTIQGAGHDAALTKKEKYNEIINEFYDGLG